MCKSKELIDKGVCDKGFIWNPSNCECKWDKSCDVSEYLDYENCKCRKKIVNTLIEECTENVEEVKITLAEDKNKHKSSSCTLCIVLILVIFTANVGIGNYFLCFYFYLKKDVIRVKFGTRTQTTI